MTSDNEHKRRWEGDVRGRGIASGAIAAADVERLAAEMKVEDWVAEEPEVHLLPHLRSFVARHGSWGLVSAEATADGRYHVRTVWRGESLSRRQLRAEVFALIGAIAEHSTHVRERRANDEVTFEVATGILEGDFGWTGHGHVLVIYVETAA